MPTDGLDIGPVADRPAPSPYNRDKLWFDQSTARLSISDGTDWYLIATGALDVPDPPDPVGATLVSIVATGNPGEVEITGTGLDFNPGTLGTIRLYYTGSDGGPYIQFDNWVATGGGTSVIVVNGQLEGATVNEVELFDDQIQTNSLTSSTTIPDLPLVLA